MYIAGELVILTISVFILLLLLSFVGGFMLGILGMWYSIRRDGINLSYNEWIERWYISNK